VIAVTAAFAVVGSSTRARASGPFAWLHPAAAPAGWLVARTARGATFAYPPGWRPIKTDPGTASVALLGDGGQIEGFLNETPTQGGETLANWSHFRPQHNSREGDRDVRVVAVTESAAFRSGRASCVIDTYATSQAHYQEISCLVADGGSSAVVVGAAPSARVGQQTATLEHAIATFTPKRPSTQPDPKDSAWLSTRQRIP
jgi:hypothetical protein